MKREDAILEMWANYESTLVHVPGRGEGRNGWDEEFYAALAALGVSRMEVEAVITS